MIIRPPYLKRGDTIGIVSTARKLDPEAIEPAIEIINSWGLNVRVSKNLFNQHHQFAGTDQERTHDFQQMIDDPDIQAIFCARGGYGSTRIIDKVNFYKLYDSPKWIVGFSDVTAILCHLHNLGIESIHGIMPILYREEGSEMAIESLKNVLWGQPVEVTSPAHPLNREGEAQGQVIGGNLSILAHIIGTGSDIDTQGKILFIEDLDEYLYHIDRMMIQLKRAGKLHALAGLVVGQMTEMKDNKVPFGSNAYEIIHQHVSEFSFPVCYDFPVGHVPLNIALPCSRVAKLEVSPKGARLQYIS